MFFIFRKFLEREREGGAKISKKKNHLPPPSLSPPPPHTPNNNNPSIRFAPGHLLAPRHLRRPHREAARLGRQLRALGGARRRQASFLEARAALKRRRGPRVRLVSRPRSSPARSARGPSRPDPSVHALRAQVRSRGQREAAWAGRRRRRAEASRHGTADVQAMTISRILAFRSFFFFVVVYYPAL